MTNTPTSTPTFQPAANAGIVLGSAGLGVVVGVGCAAAAGWAGRDPSTLIRAGALAGIAWLIAGVLGAFVLALVTNRRVDALGMGVLASSMARMLLALLVSLPVFFVGGPDGRTFWTCFLLAGLAALCAETAWGIRQLRSLSATPPLSTGLAAGSAGVAP